MSGKSPPAESMNTVPVTLTGSAPAGELVPRTRITVTLPSIGSTLVRRIVAGMKSSDRLAPALARARGVQMTRRSRCQVTKRLETGVDLVPHVLSIAAFAAAAVTDRNVNFSLSPRNISHSSGLLGWNMARFNRFPPAPVLHSPERV